MLIDVGWGCFFFVFLVGCFGGSRLQCFGGTGFWGFGRSRRFRGSHRFTVRLEDLNKPIPHDLLVEIRRLEKLEHNTLVQHGFIKGSIISIPEPETEHKKKKIKIKSEYLEPTSHKRKYREKNENNAQGSKVRVKRAEWNKRTRLLR